MPKATKTFLDQIDIVPPCVVRLNAYKWVSGDGKAKARLLSYPELAKQCGLSERMVLRLGAKKSWAGVKADVISKFLAGCNADLIDLSWFDQFITKFADAGFPQITDKRVLNNVSKLMGWRIPN